MTVSAPGLSDAELQALLEDLADSRGNASPAEEVLRTLDRAGSTTVLRLAVAINGADRAVRELEGRGLVERTTPAGQRAVSVRLTEVGRRALGVLRRARDVEARARARR